MTVTQRRIVLAMLLSLAWLEIFACQPSGLELESPLIDVLRMFWAGAYVASTSLMASWTALRRQPLGRSLTLLFPWAGILALSMVASESWIYSAQASDDLLVTFFSLLLLFLGLVLVLALLRRFRGWEIALPEEAAEPVPVWRSFTLRQGLLGMLEVALLLGLAKWLLSLSVDGTSPSSQPALSWDMAVMPLVLSIAVVLILPMILTSLRGFLEDRLCGRWILGMIAWAATLAGAFVVLDSSGGGNPWTWDNLATISLQLLSVFGCFTGGLLLLRQCGYRLRRSKAPLSAPASEPQTEAVGRTRLVWAMAVLIPLLLATAWSALHFVSWRAGAMEQTRFNRPWLRVGLSAARYDRDVSVLGIDPVPSEAALAMLADPQYAADIVVLDISRTKWSDAHLAAIAHLTQLVQLDLAGTQVTDAGLVHLYGLKKLRRVNLNGCPVTPEGVAQLQAALPDCQITGVPQSFPPK